MYVVAQLLNIPEGYTKHLVNNGGLPPLVNILARQTPLVVDYRQGSSAVEATNIVPILLALLCIT